LPAERWQPIAAICGKACNPPAFMSSKQLQAKEGIECEIYFHNSLRMASHFLSIQFYFGNNGRGAIVLETLSDWES
jgi:hypothetical protein